MKKLITNKLRPEMDFKILIFLIVLFVFLSNVGSLVTNTLFLVNGENSKINILETPSSIKIDIEENTCNFTKYEISEQFRKIEENIKKQIIISFYEHPSSIRCHGRPVIISSLIENESEAENQFVPVGIGVNTDIDNFEKVGKFLLIFLGIALIISQMKFKRLRSFQISKVDIISTSAIFIIYSLSVHKSFGNSLTDFLLYITLGNYLFAYISNFFSYEVIVKSLVSLSIIPFMFKNSNISFFWLTLLFIYNLKKIYNISIPKPLLLFYSISLFSLLLNLNNFFFTKQNYYFDWTIFKAGRHQGGIADMNNGLQSFVYIFDIWILLFIFFVLLESSKSLKLSIYDMFDSLINGFVIWISLYAISQINHFFNFFIVKSFGLNETIDEISTYQLDGINWRGVTSSHELTGFWLAIITSIIIFQLVHTKKIKYLLLLVSSLISLSLNSQRTALLIFTVLLLFLVLKNIRLNKGIFASILILIFTVLLFFPSGPLRLIERLGSINYSSNQITEYHQAEIRDTYGRYERFNFKFEIPQNNFKNFETFQDYYSAKLNINSEPILNIIVFTSRTFGRDIQWIRFIHFNNLEKDELIFGKGPGQSFQLLDLLIEKPHSLYLTTFYQLGLFGLLFLLGCISYLFYKFYRTYQFEYLLGIMVFVNGIKNEFVFTHNYLVWTTTLLLIIFLNSNNKQSSVSDN